MAKIIFLKPGQKSRKRKYRIRKKMAKVVLLFSLFSNAFLIYYILTNINV